MQGVALLRREVPMPAKLGKALLPGLVHDDCGCNLHAANALEPGHTFCAGLEPEQLNSAPGLA